MMRRPINAMDREPIRVPLDTGVRAINSLVTIGRGQRVGLFAGTGVGKSVLLAMMAPYAAAAVIVVALVVSVAARSRNCRRHPRARRAERSVVVAAPADALPLVRMQAATRHRDCRTFHDQGQHVLLLMDSLTRYAMAQREIALAIGEPPAPRVTRRVASPSCRSWWSARATV